MNFWVKLSYNDRLHENWLMRDGCLEYTPTHCKAQLKCPCITHSTRFDRWMNHVHSGDNKDIIYYIGA